MLYVIFGLILLFDLWIILKFGLKVYLRRWFNVLIGLDQTANAFFGGDVDETISSRAAKRADKRGWKLLVRILEAIDPGHTKRALEPDEGKDAIL